MTVKNTKIKGAISGNIYNSFHNWVDTGTTVTGVTLDASEPTEYTHSFTVDSGVMASAITGKYHLNRKPMLHQVLTGASPSAGTIYYKTFKNGVLVISGSLSRSDAYWSGNFIFEDVSIGDVLSTKVWGASGTLTHTYYADILIPGNSAVTKNCLAKGVTLGSTYTASYLSFKNLVDSTFVSSASYLKNILGFEDTINTGQTYTVQDYIPITSAHGLLRYPSTTTGYNIIRCIGYKMYCINFRTIPSIAYRECPGIRR